MRALEFGRLYDLPQEVHGEGVNENSSAIGRLALVSGRGDRDRFE